MPTVDELLNASNEVTTCTINPDTREIIVPEKYKVLGVFSDEKVTKIPFTCPKVVGNNVDLTEYNLYINYQNASGMSNAYLIEDVVVSGDNITFSWLLSRNVTLSSGVVKYSFCAKKLDGDTISNEWNTTIATGLVIQGLEATREIIEENPDIIETLVSKAHTHSNKAVLDKFAETNGKPTYNGAALGGGGSSDFVIKMTVEANGDDYTVISCDATVEQIDAAVAAEKRVVVTASIGVEIFELPMLQGNEGSSYYFGMFLDGQLMTSLVATDGSTSKWLFSIDQIVAETVDYSNAALPSVTNVRGALDELVLKSHTHSNKGTLDKLSDSNGKLQYNGSDVGIKGYTPVRGTDYWTSEDVAEIKRYITENIIKAYLHGDITDLVIPEGTVEIEAYKFQGERSIRNVDCPSTFTTVGNYAFQASYIESIDFSKCENVAVNTYAFNRSNLKNINASGVNILRIESQAFSDSKISNFDFSVQNKIYIGDYAFSNTKFRSVYLTSNIITLSDRSFYLCKELESVRINGHITNIPGYCFNNCTVLSTVILEEGVRGISQNAFSGCPSITKFELPSTITRLDRAALSFAGGNIAPRATVICKALTPPTIQTDSFGTAGTNTSVAIIYVPDEAYDSYITATNWVTLYNQGRVKPISELPQEGETA